jgi:beta-galactosidase
VHKYYDALFRMNIQTDMVGVEEDLSAYDIVIAPVLYMLKPGYAEKVEAFVRDGGTFITTFFSGIVNENDIVTLGGYPGELRKVLGIWAEEIDALFPDQHNQIVLEQPWGQLKGSYECGILCDLIHSEGAEVLARYGTDFYAGMPVLTRNPYGQGQAFYVASSPDPSFLTGLLANLCEERGIKAPVQAPAGVEVSERVKDGRTYLFLLNHNADTVKVQIGHNQRKDLLSGQPVSGEVTLTGKGVMIIQ